VPRDVGKNSVASTVVEHEINSLLAQLVFQRESQPLRQTKCIDRMPRIQLDEQVDVAATTTRIRPRSEEHDPPPVGTGLSAGPGNGAPDSVAFAGHEAKV
jgi:hypothetical protein